MDIEDAAFEDDEAVARHQALHRDRGRMAEMASARSQSFHAFSTAQQQQPQPIETPNKASSSAPPRLIYPCIMSLVALS